MSGTPPPDGLSEAIGKAIVDDAFYQALKQDPDAALKGTSLSPGDRAAVKRILTDKAHEIDKARRDFKQSATLNAIIVEIPPKA
jgi:hypothetical protein